VPQLLQGCFVSEFLQWSKVSSWSWEFSDLKKSSAFAYLAEYIGSGSKRR
jgi:hypothetical protein